MRAHLILAVTVLLALSTVHAAEVYRWVDKNGKVHYSEFPPPENTKDAELKRIGDNAIDVDKLPYATRDAVKKNPVTLYATNCGEPCDSARQLLSRRGIPFTSKNPETSKEDADKLKQLVGALEVPILVVGSNNPLKGFEAGGWEAALDAAGYPKTALTKPSSTAKPLSTPEVQTTPK